MKPLRINRMALSPLIWNLISPNGIRDFYFKDDEGALIEQADYKTGTLSPVDAGELRAIVEAFEPKVVAEVGTYIGRSTRAMAAGMPGDGNFIYTCDGSNDIELPRMYGATVEQFPKTTSTDMFRELVEREIKVDMFYIDGRLNKEDGALMAQLNPQALIVLDDFEGVEKGVHNAMSLLLSAFPGHVLVYPREHCKTALLIPPAALQFVSQ